jgi:CheY-like chemotaxis protein
MANLAALRGRRDWMEAVVAGDGQRAVLVVEDDAVIRALLAELLRDEGYEVFEAADGESAIAALSAQRPSPTSLGLVILDMMIPIASGVQVIEALVGWGSFVPVLAVSADVRQLRRATAAGADETLAKPYDLDHILAVVERNCRG